MHGNGSGTSGCAGQLPAQPRRRDPDRRGRPGRRRLRGAAACAASSLCARAAHCSQALSARQCVRCRRILPGPCGGRAGRCACWRTFPCSREGVAWGKRMPAPCDLLQGSCGSLRPTAESGICAKVISSRPALGRMSRRCLPAPCARPARSPHARPHCAHLGKWPAPDRMVRVQCPRAAPHASLSSGTGRPYVRPWPARVAAVPQAAGPGRVFRGRRHGWRAAGRDGPPAPKRAGCYLCGKWGHRPV